MKIIPYLTLPLLLGFAGCVAEAPPPVTTTTEVTRTVTTTGPVGADTGEVIVTRTPPVVRVEAQTLSPGPGYVWTRGYWSWNGHDFVWVSGHWVRPPRLTAVWVEGHWAQRGGGWVWIPGHWR